MHNHHFYGYTLIIRGELLMRANMKRGIAICIVMVLVILCSRTEMVSAAQLTDKRYCKYCGRGMSEQAQFLNNWTEVHKYYDKQCTKYCSAYRIHYECDGCNNKNSFDEEKVVKVHSLCGKADEVERR